MDDHILVIEPDLAVRDALRARLRGQQLCMSVLHDTSRLIRRLTLEPPSAIVLRHDLASIDGMAALRELRHAGFDMPVVIVSPSTDVADKVLAFELGASDYLVAPFDVHELLARVRNALRLYRRNDLPAVNQRTPYRFGQHLIDFRHRKLLRRGIEQAIRPSEFALLEVFSAHPMRLLARNRLIGMLALMGTDYTERGLDVLIYRTRSALGQSDHGQQYIQTVRRRGYVFVPDNTEAVAALAA